MCNEESSAKDDDGKGSVLDDGKDTTTPSDTTSTDSDVVRAAGTGLVIYPTTTVDLESYQPNALILSQKQELKGIYFPYDNTGMGNPVIAVYPREDWSAKPPSEPLKPLRPIVNRVRFLDTGKGSESCIGHESCFELLRRMQKDHMENLKLADIKYNFLISDNGTVYFGRGWDGDAPRTPEESNIKGDCIDIAYIGDFSVEQPPPPMVVSGYNWIMYSYDKKRIVRRPHITHMEGLDVAREMDKTMSIFFKSN